MHLVDLARQLGSALSLESQLFDVTGRWIHVLGDTGAVVYFGDRCARHGDHMQLLSERLPVVNTPGFDAAPTAPNPHDATMTALRSAIPGSDDAMSCYYGALDTLIEIYRSWDTATDPLVDGPTAHLGARLALECVTMRTPLEA